MHVNKMKKNFILVGTIFIIPNQNGSVDGWKNGRVK